MNKPKVRKSNQVEFTYSHNNKSLLEVTIKPMVNFVVRNSILIVDFFPKGLW